MSVRSKTLPDDFPVRPVFPISDLPVFLRPLSYLFPVTYGVDILHGAVRQENALPLGLDFLIIAAFCVTLFAMSLKNIHSKWIV